MPQVHRCSNNELLTFLNKIRKDLIFKYVQYVLPQVPYGEWDGEILGRHAARLGELIQIDIILKSLKYISLKYLNKNIRNMQHVWVSPPLFHIKIHDISNF